jgi:hypothetical protein
MRYANMSIYLHYGAPVVRFLNIFSVRCTDCLVKTAGQRIRITGCLASVYRPGFKIMEQAAFRKLELFPPSDEGRVASTLFGPVE